MGEYLTPSDFAKAERFGVPEARVKQRFYSLGWSKERAITQRYRPTKNIWGKYKDKSVVSSATFYERVQRGWTHEEAATTPLVSNGKKFKQRFPIAPEIRELAEKNGIKFYTLRNRIYEYKWSPEEAATIPVGQRRKKGWLQSSRRM
jgi:hypothetical protein